MAGKIFIPSTINPLNPPPSGHYLLWIDEQGFFKKMDSDGNITNLSAQSLNDLNDTNLSTLEDGHILVYDQNTDKWVNQDFHQIGMNFKISSLYDENGDVRIEATSTGLEIPSQINQEVPTDENILKISDTTKNEVVTKLYNANSDLYIIGHKKHGFSFRMTDDNDTNEASKLAIGWSSLTSMETHNFQKGIELRRDQDYNFISYKPTSGADVDKSLFNMVEFGGAIKFQSRWSRGFSHQVYDLNDENPLTVLEMNYTGINALLPIDVKGNEITGCPEPTANDHVANKEYVDTAVANSGGGGGGVADGSITTEKLADFAVTNDKIELAEERIYHKSRLISTRSIPDEEYYTYTISDMVFSADDNQTMKFGTPNEQSNLYAIFETYSKYDTVFEIDGNNNRVNDLEIDGTPFDGFIRFEMAEEYINDTYRILLNDQDLSSFNIKSISKSSDGETWFNITAQNPTITVEMYTDDDGDIRGFKLNNTLNNEPHGISYDRLSTLVHYLIEHSADGKEDDLGLPDGDSYVLASQTNGTRYWTPMTSGGGQVTELHNDDGDLVIESYGSGVRLYDGDGEQRGKIDAFGYEVIGRLAVVQELSSDFFRYSDSNTGNTYLEMIDFGDKVKHRMKKGKPIIYQVYSDDNADVKSIFEMGYNNEYLSRFYQKTMFDSGVHLTTPNDVPWLIAGDAGGRKTMYVKTDQYQGNRFTGNYGKGFTFQIDTTVDNTDDNNETIFSLSTTYAMSHKKHRFFGGIDAQYNRIEFVGNPTQPNDAVNKDYVDTLSYSADSIYLDEDDYTWQSVGSTTTLQNLLESFDGLIANFEGIAEGTITFTMLNTTAYSEDLNVSADCEELVTAMAAKNYVDATMADKSTRREFLSTNFVANTPLSFNHGLQKKLVIAQVFDSAGNSVEFHQKCVDNENVHLTIGIDGVFDVLVLG